MEMKRKGDFTTPGLNQAALEAAQAASKPVDAFLSTNEVSEAQDASREMKASTSGAAPSVGTPSIATQKQSAEEMYFGATGELAFARGIEITNGRWAMMGFLIAILVEASTGQGILGQLILWAKWTGLLGDQSGF